MGNSPTNSQDSATGTSGQARAQQMSAGTIGLLIATGALLLFVLQNRSDATVQFLTIDVDMPLWLLIVISAVLGAIIARLAGWLIARSRAKSTAD